MDGLVTDLTNGVHAFEITVKLSNGDFNNAMLMSCKGRRAGGDSAAALETMCDWSRSCPDHDPRRSFLETSTNHMSSLSKVM